MKQQSVFSRLLAVLMAILMVCTVVPAASFSLASAAKTSTSATASRKMSKVKVTYTKSLSYTGKQRKPKITVTYGKTTLKKNRDYTVTYKNNTDVGIAKIVIKAKAGSAYTGSKTVKFKIIPAKVKGVKAAKVTSSAVKLTWSAVKGAKGYIVYRYNSKTGEYTRIKATKKLAMAVRDLAAGKTYRFAVRAYTVTDKKYYGFYSKAVKVKTLAAPADPTPVEEPTTQTPVTEPTKPSEPVTEPTKPSEPVTEPTQPSEPATEPTNPVQTPAKVTGITVTITNADVQFAWNEVTGAAGYEVALYDAATRSYRLMASVVGLSAPLNNLAEDTPYQFAVRAYAMNGTEKVYGDYSDLVSVTIVSQKPVEPSDIAKVINLKAEKKDASVVLTWSAVNGVNGYEVATVDGTTYNKVANVTSASAQLNNLERGKELQLAVRAFVISGGKTVYGPYSDSVPVMIYNADYYGAILRSGTFRMTMRADMDGTGEQDVNLAFKDGNVDFSATMAVFSDRKTPMEFRVLDKGKKFYMKVGSGITATWLDATSLVQEGGEFSDLGSMMDMTEMFSGISFDTSKGVTVSTETKDGVTYNVETLQNEDQTIKLYTVNNDLRILYVSDQYGVQELKLSNVSGDVSDSLFEEPKDAVDLSIFMALMGDGT